MKDKATKERFVELRAQGLSFSKIAEKLKVSKQTLINWSKDLQNDIANLREIELDDLRDQHNMSETTRIELIGGQLARIKEELAKRDLSDVPTATLLNLFIKLRHCLRRSTSRRALCGTWKWVTSRQSSATRTHGRREMELDSY